MKAMNILCRFIPFIGGFITIYRGQEFFTENKWWFTPYHHFSGFIIIGCLIAKYLS